MSEAAPWLRAMENGGLGEARAKAFLMDRFWVLERSVDVEGADYLVQRRLTAQNFMDRDPPRLGVVQVKFIQDGNSSISIRKSYVCNGEGVAYGEFFLLVFTGREDHEKCYLLSAKQILDAFSEVDDSDHTLLRLRGTKLLTNSNYEVTQKGPALDRIEHALRNADFISNRRFLSGTSYVHLSPDQIDEDFLKPLDNMYGDIQKTFFKKKKELQSVLFDIEDVAGAIHKILRTTDPEEAWHIYEGTVEPHVGGYGHIGFACDFGFDEDFLYAVKSHKARLAKLQELGVEGSYFKLLGQYEKAVIQQLADPAFPAEAETIRIAVKYDSETLRNATVNVSVRDTNEPTPHISSSQKGRQVIYYRLQDALPGFAQATETDIPRREKLIRKYFWCIRRPFQAELDRLYLGEDLVVF
ncbi:hypothetical protein [Ralstonia pseudosolanacearum]|uniref:hypothetical protein n=1 Tax=Ralstonia pseudosolanacearum TaxID=1310165 RepID=UPI0033921D29